MIHNSGANIRIIHQRLAVRLLIVPKGAIGKNNKRFSSLIVRLFRKCYTFARLDEKALRGGGKSEDQPSCG